MSDSGEEWWEKDIESFTLDIKKESTEDKTKKLENVGKIEVDKERLYSLMKNGKFIYITFN